MRDPKFWLLLAIIAMAFTYTGVSLYGCGTREENLESVREEVVTCLPSRPIPIDKENPWIGRGGQLPKLPESLCGTIRAHVICGIENGVVITLNNCWVMSTDLTPEERDRYCGDGQPGGNY